MPRSAAPPPGRRGKVRSDRSSRRHGPRCAPPLRSGRARRAGRPSGAADRGESPKPRPSQDLAGASRGGSPPASCWASSSAPSNSGLGGVPESARLTTEDTEDHGGSRRVKRRKSVVDHALPPSFRFSGPLRGSPCPPWLAFPVLLLELRDLALQEIALAASAAKLL